MESYTPLIHQINPLTDCRWKRLVEEHPRSSVFHTVAWLEALRRTYGYEPVAFTTSLPHADLQNGFVFCRVDSWLTGRRLVSLPFSDHCDPLMDPGSDLQTVFSSLDQQVLQDKFDYIETRPIQSIGNLGSLCRSTRTYWLHEVDLRPDLDTLFKNCHKGSTQRKIRRAEREGLTYEEGRSETLLDAFYRLQLITRRRHQIPPQPKEWFRNLIQCFGEALKIRVATADKQPVAAILTLRHRSTLLYKYGCSDAEFNSLGGMHLLFWRSIEEAKREGLQVFDLGRSDEASTGLVTFKDRWGGVRSTLTYSRFSTSLHSKGTFQGNGVNWKTKMTQHVVLHLPDRLLSSFGDFIYKHIG